LTRQQPAAPPRQITVEEQEWIEFLIENLSWGEPRHEDPGARRTHWLEAWNHYASYSHDLLEQTFKREAMKRDELRLFEDQLREEGHEPSQETKSHAKFLAARQNALPPFFESESEVTNEYMVFDTPLDDHGRAVFELALWRNSSDDIRAEFDREWKQFKAEAGELLLPMPADEMSRWAMKPTWSLDEALAISLAYRPQEALRPWARRYEGFDDDARNLIERHELLRGAKEAGLLGDRVQPKAFVFWCLDHSISLPTTLANAFGSSATRLELLQEVAALRAEAEERANTRMVNNLLVVVSALLDKHYLYGVQKGLEERCQTVINDLDEYCKFPPDVSVIGAQRMVDWVVEGRGKRADRAKSRKAQ
jgi:hypothetical protein